MNTCSREHATTPKPGWPHEQITPLNRCIQMSKDQLMQLFADTLRSLANVLEGMFQRDSDGGGVAVKCEHGRIGSRAVFESRQGRFADAGTRFQFTQRHPRILSGRTQLGDNVGNRLAFILQPFGYPARCRDVFLFGGHLFRHRSLESLVLLVGHLVRGWFAIRRQHGFTRLQLAMTVGVVMNLVKCSRQRLLPKSATAMREFLPSIPASVKGDK